MRLPDDAARALDIALACDDAARLSRDVDYDDYADDLKLQLALVKLIEIMGEAAAKLSPAFRDSVPGVPWSEIIGMRHRLVHNYRDIDLVLVWRTVQQDMPQLRAAITPFLSTERGEH